MNSPGSIESTVPPERPTNPTHFGGDGLYESATAASESAQEGSVERGQGSQRPAWEFARRNHIPALLAVGGIVWLLAALVRRSTQR
jgi:hypothetical protein